MEFTSTAFSMEENVTSNFSSNLGFIRNHTGLSGTALIIYTIIRIETMLSVICLIISVIIYAILPEFKNLHGKNLMSSSICLLIALSLRLVDFILRHRIPSTLCTIVAVIIHINYLAFFFWTNVMAYDIWKSITGMKQKKEVFRHSRKYQNYSLYVWSATFLTVLPAPILEMTNWVPTYYKPQFGIRRCWLNGVAAYNYYFNLPVGVILAGNMCLFLLTLKALIAIRKVTSVLQTKQHQKRLNLYLKLLLVMGITWLSLFPAWVTGNYHLYAYASMLTASHGVLLFFIFLFKKKILMQIWTACKHGKLPVKKTSTSVPTTSTSSNRTDGKFST
ncbi:G-protein coupled receptor Mth2-like [Uloborus diversus]|uniref:G-protein coupled receptor Mth2-like n=1 Tax=Uloborus diversus TaxID=327109 RepID=UPI0024095C19|nr:G-protein coupled receptor Mth2-like [Uloborus diversus]